MKKLGVFIIVALLLLTGVSFAQQKEKVTIWFKKAQVPVANDEITKRVEQFAKENNVDAKIEIIAYEDFFPKWTAAIESGQVPDITFLGYQEVGQFYSQGVLMDISDLYSDIEKNIGPIYSTLKTPISFDGKQYAIPFWTECQVLYYRKDLLAAAGFNEAPKTWDEFKKIAKATTNPAKGIYGAGIGYGKGNSDAEWLTRAIIWSFGGVEASKDGKIPAINSPETIQATKFITDIFTVDKSTFPNAVSWDDAGNNKAYLSGQAAMIFNTGSVLNAAKKDNPDLYNNTGLAPIPAGPKGAFVPGINNCLSIFKKSKNPETAKKLVKYLLQKDWYGKWIEAQIPLAGPVLSELGDAPVWKDPLNKVFVDSTKNFTYIGYSGPYTAKAGEVYNLRLINDAFQSILVDKKTPEAAIADLQKKMEEVYNKK